jgi:hypothetical protein
LKRFAHGHHLPYHRLARLWIYEGLRSEQAWTGFPQVARKIPVAAHRRKPHSRPRA